MHALKGIRIVIRVQPCNTCTYTRACSSPSYWQTPAPVQHVEPQLLDYWNIRCIIPCFTVPQRRIRKGGSDQQNSQTPLLYHFWVTWKYVFFGSPTAARSLLAAGVGSRAGGAALVLHNAADGLGSSIRSPANGNKQGRQIRGQKEKPVKTCSNQRCSPQWAIFRSQFHEQAKLRRSVREWTYAIISPEWSFPGMQRNYSQLDNNCISGNKWTNQQHHNIIDELNLWKRRSLGVKTQQSYSSWPCRINPCHKLPHHVGVHRCARKINMIAASGYASWHTSGMLWGAHQGITLSVKHLFCFARAHTSVWGFQQQKLLSRPWFGTLKAFLSTRLPLQNMFVHRHRYDHASSSLPTRPLHRRGVFLQIPARFHIIVHATSRLHRRYTSFDTFRVVESFRGVNEAYLLCGRRSKFMSHKK